MNVVEQQKHDAQMVKDMLNSEGWKVLEPRLLTRSKELMGQLIEATNMEEVNRKQSEIKAIQLFIDKVVEYAKVV